MLLCSSDIVRDLPTVDCISLVGLLYIAILVYILQDIRHCSNEFVISTQLRRFKTTLKLVCNIQPVTSSGSIWLLDVNSMKIDACNYSFDLLFCGYYLLYM